MKCVFQMRNLKHIFHLQIFRCLYEIHCRRFRKDIEILKFFLGTQTHLNKKIDK